ncbi:MAG: NAD-dependent epimerase/dehydratase family protein [Alphaproteobacteria bacterium]|nr:NAD-dependent epimerase/dehydratase family protein [Alphaproteobacteria bacterium]
MRSVAVTGANGYLGGAIAEFLKAAGWRVCALVRRPDEMDVDAHRFVLGEAVDPKNFTDIDVLIHCAWDFAPAASDDYFRVNVDGTERLLAAAKEAGVKKIIFISSMSAHPDCLSKYGQAKLECESAILEMGGAVIRPGLVWGGSGSGLHGAIAAATKRLPVVPVLAGDLHSLYMCHVEDLAKTIGDLAAQDEFSSMAYVAADKSPWSMRDLASCIATAAGKKRAFLPIPWRLVWFGLRSLEAIGLKPPFRSDSVLGLVRGGALSDPETYSDGFRPYDASGLSAR